MFSWFSGKDQIMGGGVWQSYNFSPLKIFLLYIILKFCQIMSVCGDVYLACHDGWQKKMASGYLGKNHSSITIIQAVNCCHTHCQPCKRA